MTYKCNDCSYIGTKMTQGRCAACGSANVSSHVSIGNEKKPDRFRKLKTGIMIVAWAVFAIELLRILSQ